MLALADIIPGLHHLLALLVAQANGDAADRRVKRWRMLRLMRTIRRLTRVIIETEVSIYQWQQKRAMLSDPVWRARVIAALDGYAGLYQWRAHYMIRTAQQNQSDAPLLRAARAANSVIKPRPVPTGEFRLLPLPRRFLGRRSADAFAISNPYIPRPMTSPFNGPIALHADEFLKRRNGGYHSSEDFGADAHGMARTGERNAKPPKPEPP